MSVEQTPAGRASTRTAALFDGLAARYDAWYEGPAGRVLFPLEVACLWPLVEDAGRPRLEIGVGSGRFAQALEVEVGLDPAPAPLALARRRGVWPVQGVGELLPFGDGTFGAALVVVTLCFADDPLALLAEARRVLRPRGVLVLGMVFADSPWRAWYRQKGEEGHTFCPAARFLTGRDVHEMLGAAGFRCPPGPIHPPPVADGHTHAEPVLEGEASGTGFVALQAG